MCVWGLKFNPTFACVIMNEVRKWLRLGIMFPMAGSFNLSAHKQAETCSIALASDDKRRTEQSIPSTAANLV